jgi:hypothetical protein
LSHVMKTLPETETSGGQEAKLSAATQLCDEVRVCKELSCLSWH